MGVRACGILYGACVGRVGAWVYCIGCKYWESRGMAWLVLVGCGCVVVLAVRLEIGWDYDAGLAGV